MKVTDAEVRFIREVLGHKTKRLRRGSSIRLAKAFGITPAYLHRIAAGTRRRVLDWREAC